VGVWAGAGAHSASPSREAACSSSLLFIFAAARRAASPAEQGCPSKPCVRFLRALPLRKAPPGARGELRQARARAAACGLACERDARR
jgi:hypothetical protein